MKTSSISEQTEAFQTFAQRLVIANALNPSTSFRVPAFFRIISRVPILRDLPARFIAFGVWPVHVR